MCTACAPHVHRRATAARTPHCLCAVGVEPPGRRTAVAAGGAARDGGSSRRAADARLLLQATPRGARPLRAPSVPGVPGLPVAGRVGNELTSSPFAAHQGWRSQAACANRRACPPAVSPPHTMTHTQRREAVPRVEEGYTNFTSPNSKVVIILASRLPTFTVAGNVG